MIDAKKVKSGLIALQKTNSELAKDALALIEDYENRLEDKTAEVELEGGGITWFFVCGECHSVLKNQANYCHVCGRKVKWT